MQLGLDQGRLEQGMTMVYAVPGKADDLDEALTEAWNRRIRETLDALSANPAVAPTRFFATDPGELAEPTTLDVAHWPGNPLEPTFCFDADTVQQLCDWGARGRHALHNEYCEYAVIHQEDERGELRPKRVEITTELAEYWTELAARDPEKVRAMATEVLSDEPSWDRLYGVEDPTKLSETERRIEFARTCAGHGQHKDLDNAGVGRDPTGPLNTERALFMTHPINGLDDLLFIVLFGARPDGRAWAALRALRSRRLRLRCSPSLRARWSSSSRLDLKASISKAMRGATAVVSIHQLRTSEAGRDVARVPLICHRSALQRPGDREVAGVAVTFVDLNAGRVTRLAVRHARRS